MRRLVLALALLIASVRGASAFDPFFTGSTTITWPGGTATYRVNASSFTGDSLSDAVITASFNAWSNDALANLTLTRGADLSGTAEADANDDGINEVEHVTSGWSDGSGVLGVTYVYFSGTQIAEADMYINGQDFEWDDPTGGGCFNRFDLGATVTHEAGHFIGLGHSSESDATCNPASPSFDAVLCDATMYYAGGPCDTAGQSLECDDRAGVRYLYPPSGTRRADWEAQAFTSNPAPGAINSGTNITISGTALNSGSLSASAGIAAVYVTTAPGSIAGGTRLGTTDALGALGTCRSEAVSLPASFSADQAGTRWLVVRLDDGTTTTEYDDATNNLASIGPFTVTVAGPVLAVSPASLEFDGAEGGAAPAPQAITVTNTGSGTFTWTASDDRPWISLSDTSGAPGESFNVTLNTTGLAAGRHEGTVTVTAAGAAGSPKSIAIGLDLTAGAVLDVSPASLTFNASPGGALPATQQLAVSNAGTGAMSWTASDDQTWMSVAPGSGSAPGNVTVSITTTSLAAGTYNGNVTVTATGALGSPEIIPVTYQVTTLPPALDVAPASLTFSGAVGSSPASQGLSVTNTGGGTLNYTASSNRSWISALPASGSAPGSVTVSVNTSGLAAGSHSGSVTITAAGATGSPKIIPVSLTLSNQPSLSASPGSLAFATSAGTNPANKTLTVGNDGTGSLTYAITDDAPWLSLNPATGASLASGATRAHQLQVDVAGLAAGLYQANVTVTAAAADDSPVVVPVSLEVGERPPLIVAPLSLAFAATPVAPSPASQGVSVSTSGAAASWTASPDVAWLTVTPAQGIGDGQVSVRASSSGLAAGVHQGQVTIGSASLAASPQVVDVSFTVEPGPRLVASPSSIRWSATRGGSLPAAQQLDISNAGTGTLSWSITGAPSWLQVAPASGSGAATVTLTPTTTNLPPGILAATLQVTAANSYDSPRSVELTYDIVGPSLAFTPERVRFELSGGAFVGASQAIVQVGSLGGAGGASWTAVASVPWLTVTPASGVVGDTVTIGLVQPARLRPGVLDASVIFSSTGAANSPAPVPVSVVVRQAPGLAVHPQSIDVVAVAGAGLQPAGVVSFDEAGDRSGDFTLGARPSWLVPQALSGASGARLAFQVDPTGLAAGSHAGSLQVVSGGQDLTVPVRLDLRSTPSYRAEPGAVALSARAGGMSSSVTVSIDNDGASPDAFTATPSASWIVVSPSSGTAPDSIGIRADAAALTPGTHRGTVSVGAATGVRAVIDVTASVAAATAPAVSFTQDAASGCAPLSVTFTDTSSGGTSRTWRFDDGSTATTAAVTKIFDLPGEHRIDLVSSNASGSATASAFVSVRQAPLAHAGADRRVAFEPDGETRVALEDARAVAAAPASLSSITWTTNRGTFADTGTATSSLERPVLVLLSGRGGLEANLTLSVEDDSGCVATDAASLFVRADIDFDGDTAIELTDNCPGLSNSLQADTDADGWGTPCDSCTTTFDPTRADADGSGVGDACEPSSARAVTLPQVIGRACDGGAEGIVTVTGTSRVRRVELDVTGRAPAAARAHGAAGAAGGVGVISTTTAGRAELRVPAGVPASGARLVLTWPLTAADDVVVLPCADARFGWAASEAAGTCADGEIRLRPDGDIAPAGAPNGTLDVGDVVRLLRASVQLEILDETELARADLAPGANVAGTWEAAPDCRIDVADVVVALRATVGLVQLLP